MVTTLRNVNPRRYIWVKKAGTSPPQQLVPEKSITLQPGCYEIFASEIPNPPEPNRPKHPYEVMVMNTGRETLRFKSNDGEFRLVTCATRALKAIHYDIDVECERE